MKVLYKMNNIVLVLMKSKHIRKVSMDEKNIIGIIIKKYNCYRENYLFEMYNL
jgi:hypothetical protein